jgi:hypothetical protein
MGSVTRIRLSALVAVLVAALGVAACGGSSSKSSSSSNSKQAEKQAAATGDIPDSQVFLTYKGTGYSIKYPEGWTRSGSPTDLTFRDKGNYIHLVVKPGQASKAVTKTTSHTLGPPDPVTGKRPQLLIDRYVYSKGGKVATLDEATPKGVDNVDAYKLIAKSFRWQ